MEKAIMSKQHNNEDELDADQYRRGIENAVHDPVVEATIKQKTNCMWEEYDNNPEWIKFHTTIRHKHGEFQGGSLYAFYKIPSNDSEFLNEVGNIDGVTAVSMGEYRIAIAKAKLFDWSEIKSKFIKIYCKYYGPINELTDCSFTND